MVNKQASEGNILVNENLQKAKLITAPNEAVAASWIELPESLTDEQLIDEYCKHIWIDHTPERPIRVVVSEAANKQLTMHPTLHKFIPYVYLMGIPKYDTIRGIEVYLEEILPMSEELYTADLVKAELIKYGCKFEDKAL